MPGSISPGMADRPRTSPAIARRADDDLGDGDQGDRPADPAPGDREQRRPDRDPDQEHPEDQREDVRRVAGPRRQQSRPEDLVAERGQARTRRPAAGRASAARRRRVRGSVGVQAGSRHAVAARGIRLGGPVPRRAGARRRPAVAEHAAAITSVPVSPNSSIRTQPGDERPDDRARACSPRRAGRTPPTGGGRRLSWRVRVGRVAPIRTVAGAEGEDARARTGSARGRSAGPRSTGRRRGRRSWSSRNVTGVSRTTTTRTSSISAVQPERRCGPGRRAARRRTSRSRARRRSRSGSSRPPGSCCRRRARAGATRRPRTSARRRRTG